MHILYLLSIVLMVSSTNMTHKTHAQFGTLKRSLLECFHIRMVVNIAVAKHGHCRDCNMDTS